MANSVSFNRPEHFDLDLIFDCGQSFRFVKSSDCSYSGIAFGKAVDFIQDDDKITIVGADECDFESIWKSYLALDIDYSALRDEIVSSRPDDEVLKNAMEFGSGIRLLRQEKWETLCSFIISQNNNIPRIRSLVESLSREYGDKIESYSVGDFYSFPSAERVAEIGIDKLRALKVGFRAPYIHDAATKVASGEIDLDALDKLPTDELLNALMSIKGVGLKVASCVALFAYGRLDCFPIDVWVKRVLEKYYPDGFDHTALPNTAGLVQQYLFYYERFRQ
ncbi:MAG: DNA-3-methyladenine glycosylase 2 family protein [Ruminococcaceae bacterium]|nr:DNA-3-methyladenine glycosylase 2 family protein [Oscillospiraceae bacterium]